MRKLLYIPILHSESDLGSLAPAISRQTIALCGEERWAQHREIVSQFWQRIAEYLRAFDPATLRIYQDGLPADGEAGLKIIEEMARRGNPNHRLILDLVQEGAVLRKTEDPSLLVKEWQNILSAIGLQDGAKEDRAQRYDGHSYRSKRNALMEARDRFIARTVNETLQEGETGVLLLGAYHNALPYLDRDITVIEVKDSRKVRAYLQALVLKDRSWPSLARYLASPSPSPETEEARTKIQSNPN